MKESDTHYMYECNDEGIVHYEIFERKSSNKCIDFKKRLFSEDEYKESYPKDNHFGKWAWCVKLKERAEEKFIEVNN